MDLDMLFDHVKERMIDNVAADTFDALLPSHKRWCFYWWYAVNIFNVKSGRSKLPNCFLDAVRKAYPNMDGCAYKGFKAVGGVDS